MQQIYIYKYPCQKVTSIKLESNFIEITLRHGCSPVHLLPIFRAHFPKNTSGGLLLLCGSTEQVYKCGIQLNVTIIINEATNHLELKIDP